MGKARSDAVHTAGVASGVTEIPAVHLNSIDGPIQPLQRLTLRVGAFRLSSTLVHGVGDVFSKVGLVLRIRVC